MCAFTSKRNKVCSKSSCVFYLSHTSRLENINQSSCKQQPERRLGKSATQFLVGIREGVPISRPAKYRARQEGVVSTNVIPEFCRGSTTYPTGVRKSLIERVARCQDKMIIPLRTCCYVFTLKQGTMLIAVIELLMSAITLFLLLLASAHAQEIAVMLQADIQENSAGTSYYYLEGDDTSVHVLPHHLSNNEMRLHRGQHVALVMIIGLYAAIAITTIHLISCMLLLYGSIMHIRQFLLPWLSVVMIGLVFTLAGLLVCVILGHGTPMIALLTGLYIQQRLFLLVVVFSHYRRLYAEWTASCASAVQRDALSIKAGYMHFPPPNKPSDV